MIRKWPRFSWESSLSPGRRRVPRRRRDRAVISACWRFLKRPGVLTLVVVVCFAASPLYLDGFVIPSLGNLWSEFRPPLGVVHAFLAGGASPAIFAVGCGVAIAGLLQMNRANKRVARPPA
jgi:hypothetical protein